MVILMPIFSLPSFLTVRKYFEGLQLDDKIMNLQIGSEVITVTMFVCINMIGIICQLVIRLPHNDYVLWIATTLLIILVTQCYSGVISLPLACIAYLRSNLISQIENEKVSKEDILSSISLIRRSSNSLAIPLFTSFLSVQILIIFCLYATIHTPANFYCIMYSVAMSLVMLVSMGKLEECYELIEDLANKAREDACEEVTTNLNTESGSTAVHGKILLVTNIAINL